MQNTIIIWKSIASDPQNANSIDKRMVVVFPKDSKNDKLLKGIFSIEKNMGIDDMMPDERLPIKISKDKKGLLIRDKIFVYLFFGSKTILNHKERIMHNVLKKCSAYMMKMEKEVTSSTFTRKNLKTIYTEVQSIYKSHFLFLGFDIIFSRAFLYFIIKIIP